MLVDTWHGARSDTTLADLTAIPGDRVLGVQLSDAAAEPAYEAITEETMRARLLPGDGVGHVIEFVRTLDRIGCQAPIVEVFSDELAAMDPSEAARRVADATRRRLSEAAH